MLKKKTLLTAIMMGAVLFIFMGQGITQKPVTIKNGFVKGTNYLEFTPDEKLAYTIGIIDGMFLAPLFAGSMEKTLANMEKCLEKMNSSEVTGRLERYLKENPQRRREPMNVSAYHALMEACR